jgi:UDP-glucose 4-epimerase
VQREDADRLARPGRQDVVEEIRQEERFGRRTKQGPRRLGKEQLPADDAESDRHRHREEGGDEQHVVARGERISDGIELDSAESEVQRGSRDDDGGNERPESATSQSHQAPAIVLIAFKTAGRIYRCPPSLDSPPVRRALVTGGAGFIGSTLVRLLEERGYAVRVYDNLSTGSAENIEGTDSELVEGDVRDVEALRGAARACDVVFHLAAGTGVIPSIEDPFADFDVNARGTLSALVAGREAGATRFLFSSSHAPVGAGAYPATEAKPIAPLSPYGASKAAGEAYCSALYGAYGFEAVAVRFSNAYGPRSAHKGNVIPLFIRRLLADEELIVYGDGSQTRDFVFVTDLAEGLIRAAEADGVGGEVFQLASGVETSINSLVSLLAEIAGREPRLRREPQRPGEILRNYSVIEKARERLGYTPAVQLEQGLRRTYEWFTELRTVPAGRR